MWLSFTHHRLMPTAFAHKDGIDAILHAVQLRTWGFRVIVVIIPNP